MARVTVEDCVERVSNRFDLVILAAQRARNIGAGAPLTIDPDNDKSPVIALREIADNTVSLDELHNNLVQSLQKVVELEDPAEDEVDVLSMQQVMGAEPQGPIASRDFPAEAATTVVDDESGEDLDDDGDIAGSDEPDGEPLDGDESDLGVPDPDKAV